MFCYAANIHNFFSTSKNFFLQSTKIVSNFARASLTCISAAGECILKGVTCALLLESKHTIEYERSTLICI